MQLSEPKFYQDWITVHRLQKLQNKAARLVYEKPRYVSTQPLLQELHLLQVKQRIEYKVALIMHKVMSNEAPSYLMEIVDRTEPGRAGLHSYNKLKLPRTQKIAGDKAISVYGRRVGNAIEHPFVPISKIAFECSTLEPFGKGA